MKKEIISDALDELDEDMVLHAAAARACGERRKKRRHASLLAAAACLAILAVLASAPVFRAKGSDDRQEDLTETNNHPEPISIASETNNHLEPISIASLLVSDNRAHEDGCRMEKFPIGDYLAYYELVESADREKVSQSVGDAVPGETGFWYRVQGHEDMQYMIDADHNLWKFICFDSEEYPYRDVLELVYAVDSAERIADFTVNPPMFDNTERGKQIQREIGSHTITDRGAIQSIYELLASLTCYGMNRWDLIDYGFADADAETGTSSENGMRLGRYLSFTTSYGNEIDGVKYTAVCNRFYEFFGIAYSQLSREQAEQVWDIIGITAEYDSQYAEEEENSGSSHDNGTVLLEATGNPTYEQVYELQEKVSQAMTDGELPGVITSALYEPPITSKYCVEVTVAENSPELLDKLRALDTSGGAMRVIYAPDIQLTLW